MSHGEPRIRAEGTLSRVEFPFRRSIVLRRKQRAVSQARTAMTGPARTGCEIVQFQLEQIVVVYDSACPVCAVLVKRLATHDSARRVALVDARSIPTIADAIARSQSIDLDRDIAVRVQGVWLRGPSALSALISLSRIRMSLAPGDAIRTCALGALLRLLYPFLRCGRRLLLTALGRPLLRHLSAKAFIDQQGERR
jgi:predicted DCC family thiol-disulfide oxidoreductase YuxK